MLSQSWYLENMPPFKAAFEDDNIAIPKDADILSDLRAIQVVKGVPKIPDGNTSDGPSSNKSKQRHGDAAVALCLAWAASNMETTEYAYTPVRKTTPDSDPYKRTIRTARGTRARPGGIW